MSGKATTCTNHCGACGQHFHSLHGFDAHRTGDYSRPLGSLGGRRCLDAELVDALAPLTVDGVCRICRGPEQHGVTIYTTADYKERVSQLRPSALTASEAQEGGNGRPGEVAA